MGLSGLRRGDGFSRAETGATSGLVLQRSGASRLRGGKKLANSLHVVLSSTPAVTIYIAGHKK
jgi:hypothetical protein